MPNDSPQAATEESIQSILEWLAVARDLSPTEEATELRRRLLALRTTAIPPEQRPRLLDLFYGHAAKLAAALLPALHEAVLPISRRLRQRVRALQDILETLAQDYLDTLTDDSPARPPVDTLRPAMQCLSWHLAVSHLAAAPTGVGIWQLLHATYRTARRLSLDSAEAPDGSGRIDRIYLSNLLMSVVQPASFDSRELEFIEHYIERFGKTVQLLAEAPRGHTGVFWIDPDRDVPPHALNRRPPPPETPVVYFACDTIALRAADHLAALEQGKTAVDLGLPPFAGTPAGQGVLKRLDEFWGRPAKRKFPRRRQSYRADLCAGLEILWNLLGATGREPPSLSEWMITNESADGYAMMHVSGPTEQLRVGDVVALRPRRGDDSGDLPWQVCIVRWALSENPEHIELGLQVLSGQGIPACLALPRPAEAADGIPALLLPEAPPLRPTQALILPTGALEDRAQKLILIVEQGNVAVLELKATRLDERTARVEVLTVEADETP